MGLAFIGMMIPDGSNQFFSRLAQLVQRELSVSGCGMLLFDADGSAPKELEYIRWIAEQRGHESISAVVYIPTEDNLENFQELFALNDLPIVVLDREVPEGFSGRPVDLVLGDNALGMKLVADHLTQIGVSTVAYVGASGHNEPARMRHEYFKQYSAQECGIEVLASFYGDFSFEAGRLAGESILRLEQLPDAVVAANDLMAIGVLQALLREKKRVPDDVVVTGYDDIPIANWVFPPLTTVRQDVEEMARQAAALVMRRIAGVSGPGGVRAPIDPELVIRGSSER